MPLQSIFYPYLEKLSLTGSARVHVASRLQPMTPAYHGHHARAFSPKGCGKGLTENALIRLMPR